MNKNKKVNAAILIIGNEILSGRTQDTNTSTIALWLNSIGVKVNEVRVIPDIEETIIEIVNHLRKINDYEAGKGPLSALIGGLSSVGSLLVCPCDVPKISATGLKQILARALETEAMAVIAKSNHLEPLIGFYSQSCLPTLTSAWAAGTRAPKDALKLLDYETVNFEISEVLNVNRMSDLLSARTQLGLDLP